MQFTARLIKDISRVQPEDGEQLRAFQLEFFGNDSRQASPKQNSWLRENIGYLIANFAGGYVVIVDGKGLILTDADGTPQEIVKKAKAKYAGIPLFFRVPHSHDFLCALIAL